VKSAPHNSAFTLVEMLVVISIVGILAAIAMPTIANFRKADSMLAATRQMQDDVERARMLAISQRTKVYMIFCPANFWNDPAYNALPQTEKDKAAKLYDKQLAAYTFVTLRSVGNQPGQVNPRYLSEWRTLPQGAIIPLFKFTPRSQPATVVTDPPWPATPTKTFPVKGFDVTTDIPFPSPDAPPSTIVGKKYVALPYIAFDHLGQLLPTVAQALAGQAQGEHEYIPLAKGNVNPALDPNKIPQQLPPTVTEQPPGNSTNAFTLIHIEPLTGRARLEKQELQ
jgi:prepilin-type N-terminal cleavage/methylation domain-containing protein